MRASRKSLAVGWGSMIKGRDRTSSGDSDGHEIMDDVLLAELKTQIQEDKLAKNRMAMAVPADIRDAVLVAVLNYIRFGQVVKGNTGSDRVAAVASVPPTTGALYAVLSSQRIIFFTLRH